MSKRAKLNEYISGSKTTARGMEKVLRRIKEIGLPDSTSRHSIARARQDVVYNATEFGPLIQPMKLTKKAGGEITVFVQHPLALLSAIFHAGYALAEVLLAMEVLEVVFYSDEVHPGDAIKGNDRKVQCVYWSVLNFGTARLSSEVHWFSIACIRTSTVKRVDGGMAQIYRKLLKLFFGRPASHDLRAGITFTMPAPAGGVKFLRGCLRMFIHDEAAGKEVALCFGASGVKECLQCQTTIKYKSTLLPHPELVPSTCLDVGQFVLHTNATVKAIAERLRDAAVRGEAGLAELQKRLGFDASPESLLLDAELDINLIDIWCWDWMHCYLQNGIFNTELDALLYRLEPHDLGIDVLDRYLNAFSWPKAIPSAVKICRDLKHDLRNYPNGSASEMLSLLPVLTKYVSDVCVQKLEATNELTGEMASMLACIHVLELLVCTRSGKVSGHDLLQSMLRHYTLQQSAYGFECWLPKSHYALHMPAALDRFKVLLACFVHERRHKIVKRHAEPRTHTPNMEKGLMEEVTLEQLHGLENKTEFSAVRLLNEVAVSPAIHAVLTDAFPHLVHATMSSVASVQYCRIQATDVAVFTDAGQPAVGQIWYHVCIDHQLFTCLANWPIVDTHPNVFKCRVESQPRLVNTSQLISPCVYTPSAVGDVASVLITMTVRQEFGLKR